MPLRLVKREQDEPIGPARTGAAFLIIDAKGAVAEAVGWETLAVEAPPDSVDARRQDDPPLVRGIAAVADEARRAGAPRARMLEVSTEKTRVYALTAAPLPGNARSGRVAVTVAESGEPQAGSAEGRVIRQLGHDLRTPLTSISGAVELLQSGRMGGLHPQQEKVLGLMQKGVDNMVRMIDEATAPYRLDRRLAAELGAEVEEMFGEEGGGS